MQPDSFLHDLKDFPELIRAVSHERQIQPPLIEILIGSERDKVGSKGLARFDADSFAGGQISATGKMAVEVGEENGRR